MTIKRELLIMLGIILVLVVIQQLRNSHQDTQTMILGIYKGEDSNHEPGNNAFETLTLNKNGVCQLETNIPVGDRIVKTRKACSWTWDKDEDAPDLTLNIGGFVALWVKQKNFLFGPIQLCNGENLSNCYEKQ